MSDESRWNALKAAAGIAWSLRSGQEAPAGWWRTLHDEWQDDPRTWDDYLRGFDRPEMLRTLALRAFDHAAPSVPEGETRTFFVRPFPTESQSRMAFQNALDRYIEFLQRRGFVVLNGYDDKIDLFHHRFPAGLDEEWRAFIDDAFSPAGIRRTFLRFMTTPGVKLAKQGVTGLYDWMPIPNQGFARFLAAYYAANLKADYEKLLRQEGRRLSGALTTVEAAKAEKKARNWRDVPAKRGSSAEQQWLEISNDARFASILQESAVFTGASRTSIKMDKDTIPNAIDEMKRLVMYEDGGEFTIPESVIQQCPLMMEARKPGDNNPNDCYWTGMPICNADEASQSARLAVESPDQRTQSGRSPGRPMMAKDVAIFSFIAPLKIVDSHPIVRFESATETSSPMTGRDLAEMAAVGELDVVAGNTVMLVCREKAGKDQLSDKVGFTLYALFRIAKALPKEVFRRSWARLEVGLDGYCFRRSTLAAASVLISGFQIHSLKSGKDYDREVAAALRCLLTENGFHAAEYLLAKERQAASNQGWARELESGRALIHEIMKNEEEDDMTMPNRSAFFSDVSALTGLLQAFIGYARTETVQGDRKRELGKIIEMVTTTPAALEYLIGSATGAQQARLYRREDTRFVFHCVEALLAELAIEGRRFTDDKQIEYLQLHFDDIEHAYRHFADKYKTDAEWREYLYQVKMALYARNPEALPGAETKGE